MGLFQKVFNDGGTMSLGLDSEGFGYKLSMRASDDYDKLIQVKMDKDTLKALRDFLNSEFPVEVNNNMPAISRTSIV